MPYQLNHKKEENIIYIHVNGNFTASLYDEIMNEVVKDKERSMHAHTLWDLIRVDFKKIKVGLMSEVIEHRKKYDQYRGEGTRVAIVANDDLGFGVSRQYEAMSYEFSQKMKIFRNIEEAKAFLLDKAEDS